jgi:hypothetical protein
MNDQEMMFEEISNPLDSVEDILAGQQWAFSRMNPDELMVDVSGKLGTYRMVFLWQEEYCAMQFTCHYDLVASDDSRDLIALALARTNSSLWLGHFDLPADTNVPCFRHTSLFRGQTQSSGADHLQDLMDIALAECERFYPMFQLLTNEEGLGMDTGMLNLAILDTAGEA